MTEMIKAYNIIVNEPVFNAAHISADEAASVTETLHAVVMLGYSSASQIVSQFFGAHTARWVGEARDLINKLEGPKGPSEKNTEDRMTKTMESRETLLGDRYAVDRFTRIDAYERTGRYVRDTFVVSIQSKGGGRRGYSREWEFKSPAEAIAKYDGLVSRGLV